MAYFAKCIPPGVQVSTCNGMFILFYFIYWARIKMNIHDRWFAKKCEINTMLREYTFYIIYD